MVKHLIWTCNPDIEEWKKAVILDDSDIFKNGIDENALYEMNDEYLEDERQNLDIPLSAPILAIADLGRWDGRVPGFKDIESNIKNCLYSSYDPMWYVDERGDLCCTETHHDGVNYIIYRKIKDTASDTAVANLKLKILSGTATRADITRVTERLGDYIGEIYGWKFKKYGKKAILKEAKHDA